MAYQEGGMVLVVAMMFVYLVVSMSKKNETQQETLENLKSQQEQAKEMFIKCQGAIEVLEAMLKEQESSKKESKK